MVNVARKTSEELGKLDGYSEIEKEEIYRMIALGALKYFILKVDPRKTMMFNPEESIDFNGNTGPFIQYTYARIQSVLRKAKEMGLDWKLKIYNIKPELKEIDLIKKISQFPETITEAGQNHSPAIIANYCYDLVKEYNQFYHEFTILGEQQEHQKILRLQLTEMTGNIIYKGMALLGIICPERM
jgi:arginyl-tRNA synthetase